MSKPDGRRLTFNNRAAFLVLPIGALIVFCALFDWNWLRRPAEIYCASSTHRDCTIGHLAVRLGRTPTVRLDDVVVANASWANDDAPMAKLGVVELSISPFDLFAGRIVVPHLSLEGAEFRFERLADGRSNWTFADTADQHSHPIRVRQLALKGTVEYVDHRVPVQLRLAVDEVHRGVPPRATNGTRDKAEFTTRYRVQGTYHDASFSGELLSRRELSFRGSGDNIPIKAHVVAGSTRLHVSGSVADFANPSAIDVKLHLAGKTLANLYPFLRFPLPASPDYRVEGHLTRHGSRYDLDEIRGLIGSTDIAGNGTYYRQPEPSLQLKLHSELVDLADWGPIVGVVTKSAESDAPPTQAETNSREAAQAKEQLATGDHILPTGMAAGTGLHPRGDDEGGRRHTIDADAQLNATRVKAPENLDVGNVHAVLRLRDGILKLAPFDVDFADGRIVSEIDIDARQPTVVARIDSRLQQLNIARLLPHSPTVVQSQGVLDGRFELHGAGNSVADIAAKADGRIDAVVSQGQISNLLDALAALNGGEIIKALALGDKEIPVRCGAAVFDVRGGQGHSTLFVIDTKHTRIMGAGSLDLERERFDLTIAPEPKHPGILSLRTPLRLHGSFRHPKYELDKQQLALRGGAAIALGILAPPAALIPLIETGPGADVDCTQLPLLASAPTQAPDRPTEAPVK